MKINIHKPSSKQLWAHAVTLWVIVQSGAWGVIYNNYMLNYLVSFFFIGVSVLFILQKEKILISQKDSILLVVIIGTFLLQLPSMLADRFTLSAVHWLAIILSAYGITCLINRDLFFEIFSSFFVGYSIVSLVFFVVQPVIPFSVYSQFPETPAGYSMILYHFRPEITMRNHGLFWEAGAYQIFLTISLFWVSFFSSKRFYTWRAVVLFLGIVTTFSSTGLYCLVIYIICVLFFRLGEKNSILNKVFLTILLGLIVVLALLENEEMIKRALFGKIISGSINFESRINSIFADLEIMIKNPLGCGFSNYTDLLLRYMYKNRLQFDASACTYTVIGAILGIPMMLLILGGVWRFCKSVTYKKMLRIFFALTILLCFATESFIEYLLVYVIAFYGWKK